MSTTTGRPAGAPRSTPGLAGPRRWWPAPPGGGGPGLRQRVVTAMAYNLLGTVANSVGGILIAREIGPTDRGTYAAIVAWFGLAQVLGEFGQNAATTFFVARRPERAADYVATATVLQLGLGVVILTAGLFAAPLLGRGQGQVAVDGYRLMFVTCLAVFAGVSHLYSLQAVRISQWNALRAYQPVAFLTAVVVLTALRRLDLRTVLIALAAAVATQSVLAYLACRRVGVTGGRPSWSLLRPMARYGAGQLASLLPLTVTARLDQLVLSLTVAPALLGNYAIAVSMTGLTQPFTAALGAVAFPTLAARALGPDAAVRLRHRSIVFSIALGLLLMAPMAVTAPWLVPMVYGAGFRQAPLLVAILAPAGVCLGCAQVCADLLRGAGRPMAIARAQFIAAVVTVGLLAGLVPPLGVTGAAVATSLAGGVALGALLWQVRRHA